MVSNARLDLPDPDRPVNTTRLSRGMSRSTPRRLCSRAPRTINLLPALSTLRSTTVGSLQIGPPDQCGNGRMPPRSMLRATTDRISSSVGGRLRQDRTNVRRSILGGPPTEPGQQLRRLPCPDVGNVGPTDGEADRRQCCGVGIT